MNKEIAIAMANLTTGIYVLTVDDGTHRYGMGSARRTFPLAALFSPGFPRY
jgi:hypothetical protein